MKGPWAWTFLLLSLARYLCRWTISPLLTWFIRYIYVWNLHLLGNPRLKLRSISNGFVCPVYVIWLTCSQSILTYLCFQSFDYKRVWCDEGHSCLMWWRSFVSDVMKVIRVWCDECHSCLMWWRSLIRVWCDEGHSHWIGYLHLFPSQQSKEQQEITVSEEFLKYTIMHLAQHMQEMCL
jgi:hypothetical protein